MKKSARVYHNGCVECKCIPISLHKRVSLLLNTPHTDKIALTNGVSMSEFAHFQILRTFLVKFQKTFFFFLYIYIYILMFCSQIRYNNTKFTYSTITLLYRTRYNEILTLQ